MDLKEAEEKIGRFVRVNKCGSSKCLKLSHISCCNIKDYLKWRNKLMKPHFVWNSDKLTFDAMDGHGKIVYSISAL